MKISYSQMTMYLTCKRAHWYSYYLKLINPNKSEALKKGSNGHELLEIFFKAFKAADPNLSYADRYLLSIEAMMAHFTSKQWNGMVPIDDVVTALEEMFATGFFEKYEIVYVEQSFFMEFKAYQMTHELEFIVDLIVRERDTGLYYLIDWKFVGKKYSATRIATANQMPLYSHALLLSGIKIEDCLYGLFVNGKFSWESLGYKDHRGLVAFEEMCETTVDIAEGSISFDASKGPGRSSDEKNCGYCNFSAICISQLNGEDIKTQQMILDSTYEPKTTRPKDENAIILYPFRSQTVGSGDSDIAEPPF